MVYPSLRLLRHCLIPWPFLAITACGGTWIETDFGRVTRKKDEHLAVRIRTDPPGAQIAARGRNGRIIGRLGSTDHGYVEFVINRLSKTISPTAEKFEYIEVTKDGYLRERLTAEHFPQEIGFKDSTKARSQPQEIVLALTPAPIYYDQITIDTVPREASIYDWNGDLVGVTSSGPVVVRAEVRQTFRGQNHTNLVLSIRRAGFRDYQYQWTFRFVHKSYEEAAAYKLADTVRLEREKLWAAVRIRSVPGGARIYGASGQLLGETGTWDPDIVLVFSLNQREFASREYTITVEKPSHRILKHTFLLHYQHFTKAGARRHTQEITVVLEPQ